MAYMEPRALPYEEFPEEKETRSGVRTLTMDKNAYGTEHFPDVTYAVRDGAALHLQIFVPVLFGQSLDARYPLVVFVQGSAWRKQEIKLYMTQAARLTQRGYAVAVVEYRPSDVRPFPAQIEDTKTAIRFLRKEAAAYHIDPERVAVMGDSSGGHTALMTGITGGTQELDTALYGEYPCTVRAIVDYYGPTDVSKMCEHPSTQNHVDPDSPEGRLIGGLNVLENPDKVAPTVVMNHVPEASQRKLPPLLMFHGTKDRLVPFEQSLLLYDKMKQAGQDVTLYRVEGADHGGPAFWAQNVLDLVDEFLKEYLK